MADVFTDEAEGAQALFCYIADILGERETKIEFNFYIKNKDSKDFFIKYKDLINDAYATKKVDTSKSKTSIIQYIKKHDSWFISSLIIAQKMLVEIGNIDKDFRKISRPDWQGLFYQHGDEEIMKVLSKLFKSANIQSAKIDGTKFFGDLNKWTPADIYFASEKAKKDLKKLHNDSETKKDNLTFAVLNKNVTKLLESGDLLPLSLKKVTKDVIITKVNFSRKAENKLLAETKCTGVQPWEKMKGNFVFKNNKFSLSEYSGGRDIYLTLDSGNKKGRIQIRHTPASNGKPSRGVKVILGYVGSSALGGQVVGIPLFTKLIDTVDPKFGKEIRKIWDANYTNFEKSMNQYIQYGGGKINYKKQKKQFNSDIGAISGLTVMNKLRTAIEKYFKNPKEKQHNVVRALFAYTASRSPLSAPFVIAKD